MRKIGEVSAGAHNMAHFGADRMQRLFDAPKNIDGLGVDIAGRMQLAAWLNRGCASDKDKRANTFGAGIAANVFEPPARFMGYQGHARLEAQPRADRFRRSMKRSAFLFGQTKLLDRDQSAGPEMAGHAENNAFDAVFPLQHH
jgi:hypothetical protein